MIRIACVVLAMALAGCAGLSKEVEAPEPDIFGFVIDQDGELLAGATIALEPGGFETTSDENGEYAFVGVPYHETLDLVASLDGYHNQSAQVEVSASIAAQVVFTLVDLDAFPSHIVQTGAGFFACRGPAPCPLDEAGQDTFGFDPPHSDKPLVDAILEVIWDTTPGSSGTFRATVQSGEDAWVQEGTSVLRMQIPHDGSIQVTVEPAGDVPTAIAQAFDVYVTHATVSIGDDYSALTGPGE